LSESGLDFLLKGGASILLLLNPVRRIFTGIDIMSAVTPGQLDKILEQIR